MNDIRHTVLWVIFGFSAVILWDRWQVFNGKEATFFPQAVGVVGSAAPAKKADLAANISGVPAAVSTPASVPLPGADQSKPSEATKQNVTVTTDVLKLSFDLQGGSIVRSEFLQHKDAAGQPGPIVLLDESAQRVYVAQTGLIAGAGATPLPTHKTAMTVQPGPRTLQSGQNELTITFESALEGGVKLIKTYTLRRGAYDIAVKHEVLNQGPAATAPQLYLQLVRDGNKPAGESSFYFTFTGPAVYTDAKKYQKVDFTNIEKGKFDVQTHSNNGYIAMVQHYFASSWILGDNTPRDIFLRKVDSNLYAVGMITPLGSIAPGERKAVDAKIFIGPQEETQLETIAPGLELLKDYGWLTILAKPLYWLLHKLHGAIGNWGWSIIALVVLLKIAFYGLNAHAYRSMAKMKTVSPKITALRERLKDKPQEMQQEMMKIYREEKVNPMGGCLPIVVQMPVFIALYWVLLSSVEMRNAPWIGWVHDLAAPDPLFILPLLMTVTTLLQTALNPKPPDPMQAKLMWLMPLLFSVMFFFFPAGLVLYWITNNVLSIAQQAYINKRLRVLVK